MEELLNELTKTQQVSWWGSTYEITPCLVDHTSGDGKQIVAVFSMNQRPNYWIVRIDSSIDVSNDDFDHEQYLLNPIEDQYGRTPDCILDETQFVQTRQMGGCGMEYCSCVEDFEGVEDYNMLINYPSLNWDCGGGWESLEIY